MEILSRDELSALVERPQEIGVSIYMPTHRTGDIEQDPIRLKNLLREAEGQLVDYGISVSDAGKLLEPASSCCPIRISGSIKVMVWPFSFRLKYFDTIGSPAISRS